MSRFKKVKVKVKVKFALEQSTMAQNGSRVVVIVVNARPLSLYPPPPEEPGTHCTGG
jgi:hypothetical protein